MSIAPVEDDGKLSRWRASTLEGVRAPGDPAFRETRGQKTTRRRAATDRGRAMWVPLNSLERFTK